MDRKRGQCFLPDLRELFVSAVPRALGIISRPAWVASEWREGELSVSRDR
jgi:hypothetical protein